MLIKNTQVVQISNKQRIEVYKACANCHVDELYVFGSVLTAKFDKNSDIDFIVNIFSEDPMEYAENYFELKFELERIFKREIDLLEQKAIRNKTFEKMVNNQKVLIYARRNQGVA